MILIDVFSAFEISGKEAEEKLEIVHITTNKNTIPYDALSPMVTSGLRLGSAAMTTKGYKEDDFRQIARWIVEALSNNKELEALEKEIDAFIQKKK